MNKYANWDDEALEVTINVMRGMCQDWREEIERITARMAEYEQRIRDVEAEQARRALGFGVGDRLAPCAEFTGWMQEQRWSEHSMRVMNERAYEVVGVADNTVALHSFENGEFRSAAAISEIPYAVARAMRAEWLRRQEQQS